MNEEAKKFKSEYFCTPKRTNLPYNRDEVIKNKFKKVDENNKKTSSSNKKDIEK